MFARRPQTPDEIRAEIAELAQRRDRLLRVAPKFLLFSRMLVPLMVIVPLGIVARAVWPGHSGINLLHVLFLLVGAALLARTCVRLWRPGARDDDPWAVADRVNFENGPRELQIRIDTLERELRERG